MPVHGGNELAELLDGFGDPGILVTAGEERKGALSFAWAKERDRHFVRPGGIRTAQPPD